MDRMPGHFTDGIRPESGLRLAEYPTRSNRKLNVRKGRLFGWALQQVFIWNVIFPRTFSHKISIRPSSSFFYNSPLSQSHLQETSIFLSFSSSEKGKWRCIQYSACHNAVAVQSVHGFDSRRASGTNLRKGNKLFLWPLLWKQTRVYILPEAAWHPLHLEIVQYCTMTQQHHRISFKDAWFEQGTVAPQHFVAQPTSHRISQMIDFLSKHRRSAVTLTS